MGMEPRRGEWLLHMCTGCCPGMIQVVKRAGYEEALILKGPTHFALWCCALISLGYVAIWFGDIISLACYAPDLGWNGGCWKCAFEAVGMGIFFACFRESVGMIAHFDDGRQRVLKQKWRELDLLRTESQEALASAKRNVAGLLNWVNEQMAGEIKKYAQEVFGIMTPRLNQQLELKDKNRLLALLKGVLQEVEELARGTQRELAARHPSVYGALAQKHEDQDGFLKAWKDGIESQKKNEAEKAAEDVADEVMRPVNEFLKTADKFGQRFDKLMEKTSLESAKKSRRVGCGRPPWEEQEASCAMIGCKCCLPRFFAIIGTLICAVISMACCCACCLCPSFCSWRRWCGEKGFAYPPESPKRIRGCCFWAQVHTKLHERLLQSALFSIAYCALYWYIITSTVADFESKCKSARTELKDLMAGGAVKELSTCVLSLARKCGGLATLTAYIPFLCICIYHIDHLDAVMETMQNILELEDVLKAIKAFHRSQSEEAEKVVLLQAIKDRVMVRFEVAYHSSIDMALHQRVKETASYLTDRLEKAASELKPAGDWLLLSKEEQEKCVKAAHWELKKDVTHTGPVGVDSVGPVPVGTFVLDGSHMVFGGSYEEEPLGQP